MSLAIVHTYIKSEQPHHRVPLGALLEAPFTLLFLSTELGECEGPGRRLPSPKVTQQGREMNREGELDGQAAPHCLLGVLGSLGLGCVGELKGKETGLSGRGAGAERAKPAGGGAPARHPQLQAQSSRGNMLRGPTQQAPHGPQVLRSHQRLVS